MSGRTHRAVVGAICTAVVLYAASASLIDGMTTRYAFSAMFGLAAFVGIAALGQTLVILLRGLDLSVPFVIGLGNVAVAQLTDDGWSFWLAGLLVVGIAACIGALSGALSWLLQVPSLLVTLAAGLLVRGGYQVWTGGQPTGSAPRWLTAAVAPGTSTGWLPVPPIVLIWAVLAIVAVLVLRGTSYGRQLYATGANAEAARYCRVNRIWIWAVTFAVSAIASAVTGVLLLGFTGGAQADVGEQYLFLTIGAVVVGGTSFAGGRGGYGGTVVGAVILTELSVMLLGVGTSQALQLVAMGGVILLVTALYGREPHVRDRV